MLIKKADNTDTVVLAEMAVKMWSDDTISELANSFASVVNSENSVCFIAYQGDLPVGFAQCQLRYDYVEGTKTSPVGYLEGIFVNEEFRKCGYAHQLLAECEKWARTKGCKEFASDCEIDNNISLQFHLKIGFEEANRIICFRKDL